MGHKVSTMQTSATTYLFVFGAILQLEGQRTTTTGFTYSYLVAPPTLLPAISSRSLSIEKQRRNNRKLYPGYHQSSKTRRRYPLPSERCYCDDDDENDNLVYRRSLHDVLPVRRLSPRANLTLDRKKTLPDRDDRSRRSSNSADQNNNTQSQHKSQRRNNLLKRIRRTNRLRIHSSSPTTTTPPPPPPPPPPPLPTTPSTDLRTWACATDVPTLRLMFGTNRNKLWGDLPPSSARRLYHALLPRTLIALLREGLPPDELAPLAFEARCAAKQYARERSHVPGRIFAMAFDGFRHLRRYGFWSSKGLSWEQIWEKYEGEVTRELEGVWGEGIVEEEDYCGDLESMVCLRILERSCVTNGVVDRLFLESDGDDDDDDDDSLLSKNKDQLVALARGYERDVMGILNVGTEERRSQLTFTAQEFFVLRLLISTKRNILMFAEWKRANERKMQKGCRAVRRVFSSGRNGGGGRHGKRRQGKIWQA